MNGILPIVAISILFLGMLLLRALLLVVLSGDGHKNHDIGGPPPRVVTLNKSTGTTPDSEPGEPTENHP